MMHFLLLATLLLSPDMEKAEALPLTDRILMVHLKEGHVVHHLKGQRRDEGERVILTELDAAAASRPEAWTILSKDDPNYAQGVHPQKLGRKSKGTDFAWMVQGWDPKNNRTANKDPDHAEDCLLYTSDAADERSSVDLGGRRIIKKKKNK